MTNFDNNLNNSYQIEFLLDRAYNSIVIDKKKLKIEPPECVRRNRKSFVVNFCNICSTINREPNNVKTFMENEMKIKMSIKDNGSLMIYKMVNNKLIKSAIIEYINKYVCCKTCKSTKTILLRENKIDYILCNTCKSQQVI